MKNTFLVILFLLLAMILLWVFFQGIQKEKPLSQSVQQKNELEIAKETNIIEPVTHPTKQQSNGLTLQTPMKNWQKRITKKPFGIYITPDNSPVQPEKFQGWHTGTDFEIFEDEIKQKIEIAAICSGKIIEKKYVSGYGGVLVQSCRFEDQTITALYGHLDPTSSSLDVGKNITQHQTIGVLAADQSFYSDGERKHLHLGISKGKQIELRGYVQTKNQLTGWLDYEVIERLLD